jgi:hypothetical protein
MRHALICLGFIACTEAEPKDDQSDTYTDADGDGFGMGADCDDGDASVFPTAPELCDGVDNDCNGIVDDNPGENGTQAWTDGDGDGYGDPDTSVWTCDATGLVVAGGDCNDAAADVSPGAEEVCDGVDNDCDGAVDVADDSVVGLTTYYLDADGDGYGGETTQELCTLSPGYVDNADDCDDFNSGQNPAVTEVSCDGLDNDCDGVVDLNLVPRDHATIQAAVDALPDAEEICLAPGTYAESIDATGRRLTVTGNSATADAILELGADGSFFTVDNWDDATGSIGPDLGKLKLQNVTIGGSVAVVDDELEGALMLLRGADVTLRNVSVDGVSIALDDGVALGGLLAAYGSAVTLDGVQVDGLTYELDTIADEAVVVGGLLLADENSDIMITDVDVANTTVRTTSEGGEVIVVGSVFALFDSMVWMDGVTVTDLQAEIQAEAASIDGLAMITMGLYDSTITNVSVTGAALQSELAEYGWSQGVWTMGYPGDSVQVSVVDLSNNTVSMSTEDGSVASAGILQLVSGAGFNVDHLTLHNNTASTSHTGSGDAITVGALALGDAGGSFQHIDIRGNAGSGTTQVFGGGIGAFVDSESLSLANVILAGNTIASDGGVAIGAGMVLESSGSAPTLLSNVTIHGNSITAADTAGGGGLAALITGVDALTVVNSAFGANTGAGTTVEGTAVHVTDAAAVAAWSHNFLLEQGDGAFFGMEDPTGDDNGNITGDPFYGDVDDEDPTVWDFTYNNRSVLRNAGHPDILDADGSVSDIGAYGGPGSEGW